MPHERMVHALEDIHRLLKPEGTLIDIHPRTVREPIEVIQADQVLFSEAPPDHDEDWDDYRKTEAALRQVVERGLYVPEGSRDIVFSIYGSSVKELNDFRADSSAYWDVPKDPGVAARTEEFYAGVDEIMRAAGREAEIANREAARISSFRKAK